MKIEKYKISKSKLKYTNILLSYCISILIAFAVNVIINIILLINKLQPLWFFSSTIIGYSIYSTFLKIEKKYSIFKFIIVIILIFITCTLSFFLIKCLSLRYYNKVEYNFINTLRIIIYSTHRSKLSLLIFNIQLFATFGGSVNGIMIAEIIRLIVKEIKS